MFYTRLTTESNFTAKMWIPSSVLVFIYINWVLTSIICNFSCSTTPANNSRWRAAQQDLMTPGERWQSVRRCLQHGQLWNPWDSLDESILHFYSQEKGEGKKIHDMKSRMGCSWGTQIPREVLSAASAYSLVARLPSCIYCYKKT